MDVAAHIGLGREPAVPRVQPAGHSLVAVPAPRPGDPAIEQFPIEVQLQTAADRHAIVAGTARQRRFSLIVALSSFAGLLSTWDLSYLVRIGH